MEMHKHLAEILTEDQRQAGFSLNDDEDFVYLFDAKGHRLASFSALGATGDSLRGEAARLMNEVHEGL